VFKFTIDAQKLQFSQAIDTPDSKQVNLTYFVASVLERTHKSSVSNKETFEYSLGARIVELSNLAYLNFSTEHIHDELRPN